MTAKAISTEFMPTPKNWKDLKPHSLSQFVDFGTGIDMAALSDHMRRNGFDNDEAVVLIWDQKQWWILDGRHKHIAAQEADVTPTFKKFMGSDPVEYVRKKLLRQHLTESQRAMAFSKLRKNLPDNSELSKVTQLGQDESQITSQEDRAAEAQVSRKTMEFADKVADHGTEELQQAVANGTLKVSDAAAVADEPAKVQNQAVADVRKGKARTARAAAGKRSTRKPKNGQPKCDDRKIKDQIGKMARMFNDRANALGQQKSKGWADVRKAMDLLIAAFDRWQLENEK